jgi:pimeloyl-ACP methyl ester carboxylesterase
MYRAFINLLYMRKNDLKGILLLISMTACLYARAQTMGGVADTLRFQPALEKFRDWYNNRQYDSLYILLGPGVKSALTPDAWKNALDAQVSPAVGNIRPFIFDVVGGGSTVFVANGLTTALALQVSFDKDLLVNGLHVVHAKKDTVAAPKPQTPIPPFSYNSEDLEYDNAGKTVHFGATFSSPKTGGPFTTLLLITGSGIQDRDETVFGHKPFAVIADYLTKKGYAVLRVDDRGAGKTQGDLSNVTSADFAKDVEAGLDYLKTRPEVNRKKLGLLGHSEGGVIAPMVAAQRKDVGFIILWGAPMVGGAITNIEQNRLVLQKAGLGHGAIDAFVDLHTRELGSCAAFSDTTGISANILRVFGEWKKQQPDSILLQLGVSGNTIVGKNCLEIYELLFGRPWMHYFLTHDFAADLSKVKCKVLAINGEKDTQVEPEANLRIIRETLQRSGNRSFTIVELKGLNHLLQTAVTGDYTEYSKIPETIAPLALETIGDWMDKTVGK